VHRKRFELGTSRQKSVFRAAQPGSITGFTGFTGKRILFMTRDVSSLGVFEMRPSQLLRFRLISPMDAIGARKKQKHCRIYSIGAIRKISTLIYSPPSMKPLFAAIQ